jgi:hypothetical protein
LFFPSNDRNTLDAPTAPYISIMQITATYSPFGRLVHCAIDCQTTTVMEAHDSRVGDDGMDLKSCRDHVFTCP